MTGKTHKAIGICTGVTFGVWNMSISERLVSLPGRVPISEPYNAFIPTLAVCVAAAAAGAMLPDIDHNNSRIGSIRKGVVSLLAVIYGIMFVFVCKTLFDMRMYLELVFILLVIAVPVIGLPMLARTKLGSKLPKVSFKHRGITHTLVPPLLMILWAVMTPNDLIWLILSASAIGYLSHLFMDCLTKSGCPILWPVTPKNISILPISTGTVWEYVFSLPVGVAILLVSGLFLPLG